MFVEAFCQKMLLNRSPCTCTEKKKNSGTDTGLFLPDPRRTDTVSVRSFSNSRLLLDPRAPHSPAPRPSARSRGPGSRSHRRVGTQTPGIRGRTCPCDPHNNANKSHSPLLAKGNGVSPNFNSKPHRRCKRPTLTFTAAPGSDVKARRHR